MDVIIFFNSKWTGKNKATIACKMLDKNMGRKIFMAKN